jgi:plasmid stabilization system protein ParE
MKVIWIPFAKKQVRHTAKYINKEFGKIARDKFLLNVHESNRLIGINPKIGKVEPTLVARAIEYRSLVTAHLNKIVYCEEEDHVTVVAFWDCRRDPNTLAAQVR